MRKKNILPLLLLTTMPFSVLYAAAVETGMNVPRPNDVMQVKTVKGQVLDSEGSPLAGVSIKVEGTRQGVVSDVNGNFVLNLPGGQDANLVFSFIGMKTQVVHSSKAGNNGLTVTMKDDATALGEVVATGMQQVKKYQMTGSASVITAKDIKDQGITSIDRILEGMVAGLNSTTLSGAPGVRSQITIRGANSLNGNTEPLWIVDGLPLQQGVPTNNSGNYAQTIMQDGVGNIMPEDIESISVLKDASAAAIYGARAANGVIVITTKKGFRSKTQVSYTGDYEISSAPKVDLDMMNSAEKLAYEQSVIDAFGTDYTFAVGRRGALLQKKLSGYITASEMDAEMARLAATHTDWFDEIFRMAQSQQHSLNLRGGNEELTYYTSVNYTGKTGVLKANKYDNTGMLVKLDYRPSAQWIFGLNVSGNVRKNQEHASAIDPFHYATFANPYERPYEDNGDYASDLSYLTQNYSYVTASGYTYDRFNILRELDQTRKKDTGLDASATFNVKFEPQNGLIFTLMFQRNMSYNYGSLEVDPGTYTSYVRETLVRAAYKELQRLPDKYDNGEFNESSGRSSSWSGRFQVDYSFNIKKDHLFTLLGAVDASSRKFNNFDVTSPVYYSDYRIIGMPEMQHVDYENIRKTALESLYRTDEGQDRTLSYIANLRYGYQDRYVLNMNARLDGADVIGDKNQFTPLWSVGGRYNIHREPFFKSSFVNELVLRASFGYTGLIDRTAYPFAVIGYGSDLYMGNRYVDSYEFPNHSVKWSRKRDFNVGMEMSVWNNRISLTADYYNNRTTDVLTDLHVPYSTGRSQVRANGGIVKNSGVEFALNVAWVDTKDWRFNTRFNISSNKNVIVRSMHNYASYQELIESSVSKGGAYDLEGQETQSVYGWKFAGVNPQTGNPRYYLTEAGKAAYAAILESEADKERFADILPSLTEVTDYVDFDITSDASNKQLLMSSLQYLGRLNPKYVGGFTTYLRYKRWNLTTNWTFKAGHIVPTFNDYKEAPRSYDPDRGKAYMNVPDWYSSDLAVSGTNRQRKYLGYWQTPGDETDVHRFAPRSQNDYWATLVTDQQYEKGDYLRMTNISLTYRFDNDLIRKWGLSNLTLGLDARNLVTFTKYRGIDVATGSAFSYPVAKEVSLRLRVSL